MKKILLTICVLTPLFAVAQHDYKIISVCGDVMLQRYGLKEWVEAKAFIEVSLDDILHVKEGAKVDILEKSTGNVFFSTETGKQNVQKRLQSCDNRRQGVFAATNKIIYNGGDSSPYVPEIGSNHTGGNVSLGAGVRDLNDTIKTIIPDLYDSIYASILLFNRNDNSVDNQDVIIEKKVVFEDIFSVIVTNNTEESLYFNAVHVLNGQTSVCYYIDEMDFIHLQPGASADLTCFPLWQDDGRYFLITSKVNLSLKILEETFNGKPIISECELPMLKIYAL
jgi:hypothetical protein